jgi:hypothetical protein
MVGSGLVVWSPNGVRRASLFAMQEHHMGYIDPRDTPGIRDIHPAAVTDGLTRSPRLGFVATGPAVP